MTDREIIDNMRLLLEPVNNKLERLDIRMGNLENRMGNLENRMGNLENRVGNLENRIVNLEYQNQKEHKEIRQDIQTLVAVLEAKGILPTTQNPFSIVM